MSVLYKTCAFTGHRPHKLPWGQCEEDARCAALKARLLAEIKSLVKAGYTDFLSGMAEGTDTWAAMAVLDLKKDEPALKLHCILPCMEQAEKWTAKAKAQYRKILEQADDIVYVSKQYHKSCMLDRNRYLIEHAGCLLAVYNGEWRGGTAATVRYAQKLKRKIILVDPSFL